MHVNFKHTYEYPPARMRLGLRIRPLIGNIQVCVLPYVLQLRPIISLHAYVRVLRITHLKLVLILHDGFPHLSYLKRNVPTSRFYSILII